MFKDLDQLKEGPYFSYNDMIESLMSPLKNQVNIKFNAFYRSYSNQKRFFIACNKEQIIDYYERQYYKFGLFESHPQSYESGFHMWDHLPYDPNGMYADIRQKHLLAHGLTILQQHEEYLDVFLFATEPNNRLINNFYLNQKNLFLEFINNFYQNFARIIEDLNQYSIIVPYKNSTSERDNFSLALSPRQHDCALLMIEGRTVKEIAKVLNLSPRTVEDHVNIIKRKLQTRNRTELILKLNNLL